MSEYADEYAELLALRAENARLRKVVEAASAVLDADSPTREMSTEAHAYRAILVGKRLGDMYMAIAAYRAEQAKEGT